MLTIKNKTKYEIRFFITYEGEANYYSIILNSGRKVTIHPSRPMERVSAYVFVKPKENDENKVKSMWTKSYILSGKRRTNDTTFVVRKRGEKGGFKITRE